MTGISQSDIQHEGRIAGLEVKVDRVLPMIEDLHEDMLSRRARWAFLSTSLRYSAWLGAGVVTLLGVGKSTSVAGWLQAYPH